jgi:hypothetical protein
MTTFNDLPLELLPGIVQNVAQSETLALFCQDILQVHATVSLPHHHRFPQAPQGEGIATQSSALQLLLGI